MIIWGVNPVLEALRAGRVATIRVSQRDDRRVKEILALAGRLGVTIQRVDRSSLDRDWGELPHQGVVAELRGAPEYAVIDLVRSSVGPPLIVVLDGVEDPHNVGAILRTVDAAGANGVVRQKRHAAPLGGVAAKASAGAMAYARIADVVNIARALGELKEAGVWTVGLAGDARTSYTEVDLRLPTALVLGAEGAGLRKLVRERCDLVASIPMRGHVGSLNVSVAAGIVLFEAVRQRGSGWPGAAR
jgi:23S rRNA (guanosine2251-2'-O)-methyltransferase